MDKHVIAPFEPTPEQWGGLARDLMMWLDMGEPTVERLKSHLDMLGIEPPQWLLDELEFGSRGVPSKGSRVTWIYKAMLAELPAPAKEPDLLDAALEALQLCDQAIENLLPGAKHIVADVGLINDALVKAGAVRAQIKQAKERMHASTN